MMKQSVTVRNKIGIHSRPAALLVDEAGKYKAEIIIWHGESPAKATSIVKLLSLKIKKGMEITISAQGEDEAEALKAIVSIVESGFGEEV